MLRPTLLATILFVSIASIGRAQFPIDVSLQESVEFERHQFSVSRHRGKVHLDGEVVPRDAVARRDERIRLIEVFDEVSFDSDAEFRRWAKKLRGTRTYTYDDVVTNDIRGQKTRLPLVLLPAKQQEAVNADWRRWLAQREEQMRVAEAERQKLERERRQSEAFRDSVLASSRIQTQTILNALARHTEHLRSQRRGREIWEVYLAPPVNPYASVGNTFTVGPSLYTTGPFQSVIPFSNRVIRVVASNSLEATQSVQARFPGYRVAGVRGVSRVRL